MSAYSLFIRADFVFAVVLLVAVPLGLLLASLRTPAIRRRMLVYWRASALLGITVYLWAGGDAMGFATSWASGAIIPLALWRGDALDVLRGSRVPVQDDWLNRTFRRWRDLAVAYNLVHLVLMLPFLACAVGDAGTWCRPWYGPPQELTAALHPDVEPIWLARYAWVALGVYAAYLLSTAVRLQRHLFASRA